MNMNTRAAEPPHFGMTSSTVKSHENIPDGIKKEGSFNHQG